MYDYLKEFVNPQGRSVEIWHENVFISINKKAIEEVEERLGYKFPEQLREFYQEIGYGHLTTPYNTTFGYKFYNTNEIMSPNEIVDIGVSGLKMQKTPLVYCTNNYPHHYVSSIWSKW
jgi:hypothetical protein